MYCVVNILAKKPEPGEIWIVQFAQRLKAHRAFFLYKAIAFLFIALVILVTSASSKFSLLIGIMTFYVSIIFDMCSIHNRRIHPLVDTVQFLYCIYVILVTLASVVILIAYPVQPQWLLWLAKQDALCCILATFLLISTVTSPIVEYIYDLLDEESVASEK